MKDVFLSHSHKDKIFVRKLAKDLSIRGVIVWFDEWEMKIGDSLYDKIGNGIVESGKLIVVLSKNSVESDWVKEELYPVLQKQNKQKITLVLPILIEECDIPIFLEHRLYADFTDSYEKGLSSIMNTIVPEPIISKLKPVSWVDQVQLFSYLDEPRSYNKILEPQRAINVNQDFLFELEFKLEEGNRLYEEHKQGFGVGFNFNDPEMFGLAGQIFLTLINEMNCFCTLASKEKTEELSRHENVLLRDSNIIKIFKLDGILSCSVNDFIIYNNYFEFPLNSCYPSIYIGGEQVVRVKSFMIYN